MTVRTGNRAKIVTFSRSGRKEQNFERKMKTRNNHPGGSPTYKINSYVLAYTPMYITLETEKQTSLEAPSMTDLEKPWSSPGWWWVVKPRPGKQKYSEGVSRPLEDGSKTNTSDRTAPQKFSQTFAKMTLRYIYFTFFSIVESEFFFFLRDWKAFSKCVTEMYRSFLTSWFVWYSFYTA